MKTLRTQTGIGYIARGGVIVARLDVRPGVHPLDDACEFVEVATRAALAAVKVPDDPAAADEMKIQAEVRRLAVESLKARGELPAAWGSMEWF